MRLIVVALLLALGAIAPRVDAGVRFELPEVVIAVGGSAPATGEFEVVVRADPSDLPADVSSFNVDLFVEGADVTLGDAVSPTTPLFASGAPLNFSQTDQVVRAAQDIFDQTPSSVSLATAVAEPIGLVSIPFEVAAGAVGEYSLDFGQINELAGPSAGVLPLDTSDTGSITVILSGDYNRDGIVDAADYTVWRDTMDSSVAPYNGADGDGNGVVDQIDLQVWQAHYGLEALLTSTSVVPEPVSIVLAATAMGQMSFGGRQRRRPNGSKQAV